MQTKNFGILLYRKVIKENDLFVKILSKDDKLVTGIVYGGNSSKKKNIYQIGYYLNLNLVRRNSNSPFTINAEIDKLRIKSSTSLMSRKDVIVIASVSCIYGIGSPDNYKSSMPSYTYVLNPSDYSNWQLPSAQSQIYGEPALFEKFYG
mgnify:CR=1 FL=1